MVPQSIARAGVKQWAKRSCGQLSPGCIGILSLAQNAEPLDGWQLPTAGKPMAEQNAYDGEG